MDLDEKKKRSKAAKGTRAHSNASRTKGLIEKYDEYARKYNRDGVVTVTLEGDVLQSYRNESGDTGKSIAELVQSVVNNGAKVKYLDIIFKPQSSKEDQFDLDAEISKIVEAMSEK